MDYYQIFVEVAEMFSKALTFLGLALVVIAILLSLRQRDVAWLIFNLVYFALATFGLVHR